MKKDITVLIIFLACFICIIAINQSLAKPSIFIIREYDAESMQGPCKIVDYTINGYATSAVFYNYENGRYEAFIQELEREGRLTK